MSLFGRFLEISVPVEDIQESLHWYQALGFSECTTSDSVDHHYAVVTDGRVFIGLHAAGLQTLTLSFVRPELTGAITELEAAEIEPDKVYLGDERYHSVSLCSPDELDVQLLEARTFSSTTVESTPLTGQLRYLQVVTPDPAATSEFWTRGGLDRHALEASVEDDDADEDEFELITPGMTLMVRDGRSAVTLNFYCGDTVPLLETLNRKDMQYRKRGNTLRLIAPEGTVFEISATPR